MGVNMSSSHTTNSTLESMVNLFQYDSFFNDLFNNLYEGLLILDTNHKIVFWNKTAEIIIGYTSEQLTGHTLSDLTLTHFDKNGNSISLKDYPAIMCLNEQRVISQKCVMLHKKGFLVPVLVSAIPLKDQEGNISGVAQIFMDDSAHENLEKAHEKIKESVMVDQLTNLLTRSEIINRIEIEMEKADRYEMPLCICIGDIDNFKKINERFGNHIGDIVLRSTSEIMKTNLRRTDIVGRYSNTEFIIILPLIDMHRATLAIEKLLGKFHNTPIKAIENDTITLSFGLTEIVKYDKIEELLDRAENALYKAKKLGKNRVETFR
jgi:diguanylate cyclase (GGDEF)-like protein/PAS domain S-box-containing protein